MNAEISSPLYRRWEAHNHKRQGRFQELKKALGKEKLWRLQRLSHWSGHATCQSSHREEQLVVAFGRRYLIKAPVPVPSGLQWQPAHIRISASDHHQAKTILCREEWGNLLYTNMALKYRLYYIDLAQPQLPWHQRLRSSSVTKEISYSSTTQLVSTLSVTISIGLKQMSA